jgi:endonuclease/exonuclease/phosphatase family metal-dependent hydrolase
MHRAYIALASIILFATPTVAQEVGDQVRLESPNAAGVPVHPAAGDQSYVRWSNGTRGSVVRFDSASGWFQVESFGSVGWVTRRYVTVVPTGEPEPLDDAVEMPTYVVGTWNIEWLRDGKSRGFPEYIYGGPTYGPRTEQDYRDLAAIIATDLSATILVLTEINGEDDGTSVELNRLVGYLGLEWAYELGQSGRDQRIAVLFNTAEARRENCEEFEVAPRRLQGKDIFDRDPLVCYFTFLSNGEPQNDLLVVGLHLASGQHLNRNHDAAMELLRDMLHDSQAEGVFPSGERDVLLAGDLNASRYDLSSEGFWSEFDPDGFRFKTLSPEDGTEYPGTRLAGVPLFPRSQIDYLLASGPVGGLADELVQLVGHVHTELLTPDFNDFRRRFSDHLPVTVRIMMIRDDDS